MKQYSNPTYCANDKKYESSFYIAYTQLGYAKTKSYDNSTENILNQLMSGIINPKSETLF